MRIRTLPGLSDLASGRVTVADFQDLTSKTGGPRTRGPPPSLLGQNPSGQVVMVTALAAAFGSELCRQIVHERPARLLLVDHSEFALYRIHHELQTLYAQGAHGCALEPCWPAWRRPAHGRHLPRPPPRLHLPCGGLQTCPHGRGQRGEGILNNVFGTLNMVRMALEHGAQHFVPVHRQGGAPHQHHGRQQARGRNDPAGHRGMATPLESTAPPFSMALPHPIFHGALLATCWFQRQRNPAVPPPDRRREARLHRHCTRTSHAIWRPSLEAAQLVLAGFNSWPRW